MVGKMFQAAVVVHFMKVLAICQQRVNESIYRIYQALVLLTFFISIPMVLCSNLVPAPSTEVFTILL